MPRASWSSDRFGRAILTPPASTTGSSTLSPRPTPIDDRLEPYLATVGWRQHPAQTALRDATDALAEGGMRSADDQVALLALLVELLGARRVLEVGCFTGYGALSMALALPSDGLLVTLEADPRWPEIGRPHWRSAGVDGRIELRLGLAQDSLARLLAEGAAASFDLAYVDADKKLYPAYFEAALELVRPGGVVALDNVLWNGAVADPSDQSHQTLALRELNRAIHGDSRVSMVLLPIGDGLMLCRRR
jgi:predicted O-methyltransferase YrrM